MRFIILFLLFALIFISQINTIVDSDLWCHFKTGEYILKNLDVPRVDMYSYVLAGRPWIDHEWLSQIIFYLVFAGSGWIGINILKAIVISVCFLMMFLFVIPRYKNIIYAVFLTVLAVLAFGYRSFIRPEVFSYLLICVFFYILESRKKLYLLPILQALWVNLHGYFIAGPILILLYCIGELVSGDMAKSRRLGIFFIITCIACLVNPYFYNGAIYPIKILAGLNSDQRDFIQHVYELRMPIGVSFGRYIFFWAFAILTSITFLVNIKKAKMWHMLVFLSSFMASYMAIRNMPVFIFLATPLAVINLNEAKPTAHKTERKYYIALIALILSVVYFFVSNKYYAFSQESQFRKTESKMIDLLTPKGACDFLEKNNIRGRIFNTIDYGHYIAYRFYPEKRIFIDGRTELYGSEHYQLYQRAQNYPAELDKFRIKYGFNIALLRHLYSGTEKLLSRLYKSKDWALVYYDKGSAIFLYDAPENRPVIERTRIDLSKKRIEASDEYLSVASFFGTIGETRLAEDVYIKLLERDPKYLEAGNNLAVIYINSGRLGQAIELLDRFLRYYPGSAGLYYSKGVAYLRTGRREDGILMFEKASRLDPYLRQAIYTLGAIYLDEGDIDRAMRYFMKYLTLDPYDPNCHRSLGDIYRRKGLLTMAESEYKEADSLGGI
jgi:tetratricopeptide (TPR) repeat protein